MEQEYKFDTLDYEFISKCIVDFRRNNQYLGRLAVVVPVESENYANEIQTVFRNQQNNSIIFSVGLQDSHIMIVKNV